GRVQNAEHGKLILQPAAKLHGAAEPALIPYGPGGPCIAQDATLLVHGGVPETAALARPVNLEGEVGRLPPGACLATVDGRLLTALHREEHILDPTVLEEALDRIVTDAFCAHARALHNVRGSPRGDDHGGRWKRSIPTWRPPWLTNGWNAAGGEPPDAHMQPVKNGEWAAIEMVHPRKK